MNNDSKTVFMNGILLLLKALLEKWVPYCRNFFCAATTPKEPL